MTVRTERLLLRPWTQDDLEPFAHMNGDPKVMECFPAVKTRQESVDEMHRIREGLERYGWGLWAVSVIGGAPFIGFIGLHHVGFKAPFTPAVEIGWRLMHEHWGKGYATEGAKASLKYGFETIGLSEIVSFTAVQNTRSIAVMKKIGMHRNPADDFDHPRLPVGHRLRRHVLYRLKKEFWLLLTNY